MEYSVHKNKNMYFVLDGNDNLVSRHRKKSIADRKAYELNRKSVTMKDDRFAKPRLPVEEVIEVQKQRKFHKPKRVTPVDMKQFRNHWMLDF